MGGRCRLCRRWTNEKSQLDWCECGWQMDARCAGNHHEWCPVHGEDRWLGAVEF